MNYSIINYPLSITNSVVASFLSESRLRCRIFGLPTQSLPPSLMNFYFAKLMFSLSNIIKIIIVFLTMNNLANAQVIWSPIGPGGGGWITTMTVVNDADNTVYVGCDVGGIYKSTDHGQTWEVKNEGLSIYFMHDIAYDHTDPATLYLASRGGVYKSTDGAETWVAKRDNFPDVSDYVFSAPVSDIAIDPQNTDIIYAGIGIPDTGYDTDSYYWQSTDIKGAIYKSIDGADHWTLIQNTGIDTLAMIFSIEIDPSNTSIVYASTSFGMYKSIDAGENWSSINMGLPHNKCMSLVIDSLHTDTLYVTLWAEPGSTTWQGGVYKSINAGGDWNPINTGLPQIVDSVSGLTTNYPDIVIDKKNPQTLYVGNIPWTPQPGVFKTIDGGGHWTWVTRDEPPNQNINVGWISQHSISGVCLTIDPQNPSNLYFGTSTHIIKTTNAGLTWDQCYTTDIGDGYWQGNGFETTVVQDVEIDRNNSNNVYAGYWDMGFMKSQDGGTSFKRMTSGMNYNSNTFDIEIDPLNSGIIYASTGWWEENKGEVCVSIDTGETWIPLTNGIPDARIWSIALDANSSTNSRTLYATSHEHGIYKTTNGGQLWYPINTGLGVNNNYQMRKVIIDPSNSQVLYAGIEAKQIETNNSNATVQGGIFKSTNGGNTWSRIDNDLTQFSVYDIKIDPNDSQIIYTSVYSGYDHTTQNTYEGGVYKTTNGGTSWVHLNNGFGNSENLNISGLTINPIHPNILYAVTTDAPYHDISNGRGIYKSVDAGISWSPINDGLTVHYFNAITLDPNDPAILYASSGGNGIIKGLDNDVTLANSDLVHFTARIVKGNNVKLQWTRINNKPIDRFTLERSINGQQWISIADLYPNETTPHIQYNFMDINPLMGKSFYRVKQLDKEGYILYSNTESVYIKNPTQIKIQPNPCHDITTLYCENIDEYPFKLYDAEGKDIRSSTHIIYKNKKEAQLDISSLSIGIYYVKIKDKVSKLLKI